MCLVFMVNVGKYTLHTWIAWDMQRYDENMHVLCFLLVLTYRMFAVYDFCFFFHCGSGGPAWIIRGTTRNSTKLGSSDWKVSQEVSSVPWRCVGFWRKFYLRWAAAAGSLAKMGWVGWICSWVDWEVQNGTTLRGGVQCGDCRYGIWMYMTSMYMIQHVAM